MLYGTFRPTSTLQRHSVTKERRVTPVLLRKDIIQRLENSRKRRSKNNQFDPGSTAVSAPYTAQDASRALMPLAALRSGLWRYSEIRLD